ncbi:hypothetical protein B0H11DRAFT_2189143 [Mycena galericulata]|nr:hypothetical protein B0H11DRAFT_2195718 [Mycena galericulata]KAJ7501235.1 hypothetical protein B0H11DRAFT_2189143 [Mycena galericulata]
MRSASLFAAISTAAMVSAQSVVTVQVGSTASSPGGATQFIPNQIKAANGTIVSFQWTGMPGNHTVTQSSFASPCEPVAGGFDSGWVFVNKTGATPPAWNVTIKNDQAPIWFYCKQLVGPGGKAHCNLDMVGVINIQASNKSFSVFEASASAAPTVGQAEGGFTGIDAAATGAPVIVSSDATYVTGAAATATAPGGSSASASPSPSGKSNSALANGARSMTVLLAGVFGMALVL